MTTSIIPNQKAQPKTVALFISDLHLSIEMPATVLAFLSFLDGHAMQSERLYLLGDIFEYWAGDDDLASDFHQPIVQALRRVSDAGVALFWLAGNRDFLVGKGFAAATNATLLADPHIFDYGSKRYLITHGDLLCTDDVVYQGIRAEVRQPGWQTAFLAHSLEERKKIISSFRQQSRLHQQEQMQQSQLIMDVNLDAVAKLFAAHHADIMIHGHTHRPACHQHGKNYRYVLSDWDRDIKNTQLVGSMRGDWLALMEDGAVQRFNINDSNENL